MGHNNSKQSSKTLKTEKNNANKQFRFWTPFRAKTVIETIDDHDINNNNNNFDVLDESQTLPEITSDGPLAFIRSTISKLLTSKIKINSAINIRETDENANPIPIESKILQNPILKKLPGLSQSLDAFRKDNIFARPLTPEMVCVQYGTVSATTVPVSTIYHNKTTIKTPRSATTATTKDINFRHLSSGSTSSSVSSPASSPPNSNPTVKTDKRTGQRSREDNKPPVIPKTGCCANVPPPAYLDYSSPSYGKVRYGGGGSNKRTGNPIIDRLKNVDVIEELKYFVPENDSGDWEDNTDDEDSNSEDYYYCCNDCGEMEPCQIHKDKEKSKGNPVTYSRRQRFNFVGDQKLTSDGEEEDDDGPPFKWPASQCCGCLCCRAGLRRNPNCECRCCSERGKARVVNSFDEIPVGKNPEPKPIKPCICDNEQDQKDQIQCEKLLPKNSGVYFYDAEEKRFIQQVPRTPTPIVLESTQNQNAPIGCPDISDVVRALPPRKKQRWPKAPEPLILPPIYGDCNDMAALLANLNIMNMQTNGTLTNPNNNKARTTMKSLQQSNSYGKTNSYYDSNNNVVTKASFMSKKSKALSKASVKVPPPEEIAKIIPQAPKILQLKRKTKADSSNGSSLPPLTSSGSGSNEL